MASVSNPISIPWQQPARTKTGWNIPAHSIITWQTTNSGNLMMHAINVFMNHWRGHGAIYIIISMKRVEKPTSSVNWGMRLLGEKTTSTLQVPPLGARVMGWVGVILITDLSCSSGVMGVQLSWNVIGEGELFTRGICRFTTWPTRKAPSFVILWVGLATSTWKQKIV